MSVYPLIRQDSPVPYIPHFAHVTTAYNNNDDGTLNVVYTRGSETPGVSTNGQYKWREVREQNYVPYPGSTPQFEFYDEFSRPEWLSTPYPLRRVGLGFVGNDTQGMGQCVGNFEVRPYDPSAPDTFAFRASYTAEGQSRATLRRDGKEAVWSVSATETVLTSETDRCSLWPNSPRVKIGNCLEAVNKPPQLLQPDPSCVLSKSPLSFDEVRVTVGAGTPIYSIGLFDFAAPIGRDLAIKDKRQEVVRLPKAKQFLFGDGVKTEFQLNHFAYHDSVILGQVTDLTTRNVMVLGVHYTAKVYGHYALLSFSTAPGPCSVTVIY